MVVAALRSRDPVIPDSLEGASMQSSLALTEQEASTMAATCQHSDNTATTKSSDERTIYVSAIPCFDRGASKSNLRSWLYLVPRREYRVSFLTLVRADPFSRFSCSRQINSRQFLLLHNAALCCTTTYK
jgi:hypothetical protein